MHVEGEKAAKRPSPSWTPCAAGHAPAQPLVLDCVEVVPPAAFAGSGLGALGRRPALTARGVGVRLGRILSLGRPVRAHKGCVSSLARATHAQHAKAAECAAPPRRRRSLSCEAALREECAQMRACYCRATARRGTPVRRAPSGRSRYSSCAACVRVVSTKHAAGKRRAGPARPRARHAPFCWPTLSRGVHEQAGVAERVVLRREKQAGISMHAVQPRLSLFAFRLLDWNTVSSFVTPFSCRTCNR